jgi:UTP--glucose-1-phosphate uridylyltransferase
MLILNSNIFLGRAFSGRARQGRNGQNNMKIRKAIIPAAGLGTRVLPASKAIPKEMLPLVDKPAIQYIVEEAANAGIEDILIITNRNKTVMEDHFDRSPELEQKLEASGKTKMLEQVIAVSRIANITYMRQKETRGLGHAVLCAKSFVGDEPFAVLYGDDVIIGKKPAIGQLAEAYDEYGLGVVGVKAVPQSEIYKYSSLAVTPLKDRVFRVTDMIEKPETPEKVLSLYSILGRCVLPPEIFDILEHTAPGAGGEIQLTDAMKELTRRESMIAVDYEGTRYDMGSKLGIMKASVEAALVHPEISEEFKKYLKELVKTI